MIRDAYCYGHIAYMDMVHPDTLSLHELNKMVEFLGVYGGIFEYLWLAPGEKFPTDLKPLHSDDDVRALAEGVTVEKNISVYVNKLTEFQARNRLALLQRRMFEVVTKRRGVVIEEVVEAGASVGMPSEVKGTSTALIIHPGLNPPSKPQTPPPSSHVQVPPPTSPRVEALLPTPPTSPPVEALLPTPPTSPPVEALLPTPPTSPPVEALLPTPPTSPPVETLNPTPTTCQSGQTTPNPCKNPSSPHQSSRTTSSSDDELYREAEYSSEDESFRADERELGDGSSEDESFTYDEELVDESLDKFFRGRAKSASSKPTPRRTPIVEEHSTIGSSDSEGVYDEFDLLDQTGWGSEAEDVEPSSFPTFQPDRDLDDSELRLGTVFESLDHFKQLCKANAVKQRRGVKFPTNDKRRCRCECQKGCGFWLYASVEADTRDVKLRSGHMKHECAVDDDIRQATSEYLAARYLGRFRVD
ncbi:hypothetical protein LINPERPRIM_LOCUS27713 [Linum perenne]